MHAAFATPAEGLPQGRGGHFGISVPAATAFSGTPPWIGETRCNALARRDPLPPVPICSALGELVRTASGARASNPPEPRR